MVNWQQDCNHSLVQETGSGSAYVLLAMMAAVAVPNDGWGNEKTITGSAGRHPEAFQIAAFSGPAAMEPTLLRWLQRIYGGTRAFTFSVEQNVAATACRILYPEDFRALLTPLKVVDDFIRASGGPPVIYADPAAMRMPAGLLTGTFSVQQVQLRCRDNPGEAWKRMQVYDLLPGSGF